MAEFAEVWENWQRMCEYETEISKCSCNGCPLVNLRCNAEYPKDQKYHNGNIIEAIVMAWAAEHPKLVYPTWGEYLCNIGLISRFTNAVEMGQRLFDSPISADIAEKLGIQPKEE